MITLKNIVKTFDGNTVLKNISTVFEQGKTNLIIGRSGSGKTVLLKSTLGLFEVDSGEIWYNERNFTQMNEKERKILRREVGMVFQGGALFDSISVEDNVRFPLEMFAEMSPAEKQKRVDFCLD
ncbi:MAG TPA: ATP-binding cassette domain-containing protein, partial [Draconibacterium sp.]|nr:ATP-binding cassette domain-containing protein [Draconibacterium sp.]